VFVVTSIDWNMSILIELLNDKLRRQEKWRRKGIVMLFRLQMRRIEICRDEMEMEKDQRWDRMKTHYECVFVLFVLFLVVDLINGELCIGHHLVDQLDILSNQCFHTLNVSS